MSGRATAVAAAVIIASGLLNGLLLYPKFGPLVLLDCAVIGGVAGFLIAKWDIRTGAKRWWRIGP